MLANLNNTFQELTDSSDTKTSRLLELAEDTKRRLKRTVEDIYHIGLNLIEAKEILGHGKFKAWLKSELTIDPSTSENFINVAKMLQAKNGKFPLLATQNFPDLAIAPSILYELAAPSTPESARDEIINRATSGEKISFLDAKKIIKTYKASAQERVTEKSAYVVEPEPPPWLTISQNHSHLAGQKCRVKYESSPGQLMCEVEDGSTVLIGAKFLEEEQEPLSIPKQQIFTLEDIEFMKEQHLSEIERLNQDWETKIQSLRNQAPVELEEEFRQMQEAYKNLLIENGKLQQEIYQLQELKKLDQENEFLRSEIKRLEHAVADIPNQRWQGTLNEQASKAVNKEVVSILEKFPTQLHLRSLALKPPDPETMPEAMMLIGQVLQNLVPIGLTRYREALAHAQTWQEFDPIAQEWASIKPNLWTELTPTERIQIKRLIEANHSFKIGSHVSRVNGDPFDAEYGLKGEIVGVISSDYWVNWFRPDGTSFKKRQSPDEINLVMEVAS
ncbi:DUF3102 domain-containing protein [Aetokthonos hydrillicola Thurmond2011]|uniref:DUF3102 domain-containing protein n=1 Tax=Aetokthonos hydrillicola Thurmond2011 TaxID=2712845 RepID=A0AAP5MEE0_9CYAN|nr:DUF3102 domain-containing protein [Aetokthonos hydrillicola]MBO3463076.1 DUF3102 domain-containing protein [Aetokthonos hydrillicola CCALA 1050]MDR9900933.1 DUF3102 domain-containing protein [Aetokthonos hydrillicola Thurmond2011]